MYCRHFNRNSTQRLAAKDLYIITSIAVSLSGFLLRKGDAPVGDGNLPRLAAAAFKVIGGMYAASNRMLNQAHPMLLQADLDVDEFLQYLEDEGLLLSPEMRACAGPVKMIRQIVNTVIDPSPNQPIQSGLSYLGTDVDRAFAYGVACVRIDLGVLLYWRSLGHYLRPLLHHQDTLPGIRHILLQEPELGIEDNMSLQDYLVMTQHILSSFDGTIAEQAFIAALPFQDEKEQDINIATIGNNCYRLEIAMRSFAHQQQLSLNQILQRQAPQPPDNVWSPAPGSNFLKDLFEGDPRLAVTVTSY